MDERERDEKGRFAPGHRAWRKWPHVSPPSEPRLFENADDLRAACIAYFEAAQEPIHADQWATTKDGPVRYTVEKTRAMSQTAMLLHIGISRRAWAEWRSTRPDLREVMDWAEAVIETQLWEAGAAQMVDPRLAAARIGLAEKRLHGSDPDNPLPAMALTVLALSDDEIEAEIARLTGAATEDKTE